jgi:hypothetical protein
MKNNPLDTDWLPVLLENHLGIYRTNRGIELTTLCPGSLYVFCNYPGFPVSRSCAQVSLCRGYEDFDDFEETFSISSPADLETLLPADFVVQYTAGNMWISGYIEAPLPAFLIFQPLERRMQVTDQETNQVFETPVFLPGPAMVSHLTLEYTKGHWEHFTPVQQEKLWVC